MVQYIVTPWRDRHELLLVRRQFYGPASPAATAATTPSAVAAGRGDGPGNETEAQRRKRQHQAVARVSMWMQRGNCPHMAESTALLTAAMLNDEDAVASENAASSSYAVRAAYAAAFSRFVTGLLDGHQDKQRKQSMYALAKTIGLPATFVELRHQATHEQLPSLAKLRAAARRALAWIWEYYWMHLGEEESECRDAVLAYLREEDEERARSMVRDVLLRRWEREMVVRVVEVVRRTLPGNTVFVKCAKLVQELKEEDEKGETMEMDMEGEASEAIQETATEEEDDFGWSQFNGSWKPKPIGMA